MRIQFGAEFIESCRTGDYAEPSRVVRIYEGRTKSGIPVTRLLVEVDPAGAATIYSFHKCLNPN